MERTVRRKSDVEGHRALFADDAQSHQSYTENIVEVIDPIARTCVGLPIDQADLPAERAERTSWVRLVRMHGLARIAVLTLAAVLVWNPPTWFPELTGLVGAAIHVETWVAPWRALAGAITNVVLFAAFGLWVAGRIRAAHMRKLQWAISATPTRTLAHPMIAGSLLTVLGLALSASAGFGWPAPTS